MLQAATMKTIIFFLMFVTCKSCYGGILRRPNKNAIAGGEYARIDEVPYQASLIHFGKSVFCGATIIHDYWVLTAAHCVEEDTIKYCVVRTGTDELRGEGVRHNIDYVVEHPEYNTKNLDNDIALIKLKAPIIFNKNQTSIPIATPTDVPEQGQFMLISGFGRIGQGKMQPGILKKGFVPVTSEQECENAYAKNPVTDNMFCAGNGIVDACDGDSGGPGIINGKLYGVISTGNICPSIDYPGVYMLVHLYYQWIVDTTGIKF